MAYATGSDSLYQVLRKYGLTLYWCVFALWTLAAGGSPRALPPKPVPSIDPYPWAGVLAICGILGAEALVLQLVLRPSTFHRSWARLGAALLLEVVSLGWKTVTILPRVGAPRYFYLPWAFSVASFAGLLLWGLILAASSVKRETH